MIDKGKIKVGSKPLDDYLVSAAVMFNQGISKLTIKGWGDSISKAVALYNALKDRMGDAIELKDVRIGSEEIKGRLISYIEIDVERIY
ncbi:MAG: DNA-binding protein [Desulfurococcales archaeon]|nr:DNA-binding protein [Desulfurococcales archaeon]